MQLQESCCVELVSDMKKISAFYPNMLDSVRVMTSTAKGLFSAYSFRQISVLYPCLTNLRSGHIIINYHCIAHFHDR